MAGTKRPLKLSKSVMNKTKQTLNIPKTVTECNRDAKNAIDG